jgi:hypothetical protein
MAALDNQDWRQVLVAEQARAIRSSHNTAYDLASTQKFVEHEYP